MHIKEDLLVAYGAGEINLQQSVFLFREKEPPENYYQIKTGKIKLVNKHQGREEFIQSIHEPGDSLGEIFLFCKHHRYPADAIVLEDATIFSLNRSDFLNLLESDFKLMLEFLKTCADRTYQSYISLYSQTSEDAIGKLITILDYLKQKEDGTEPFAYFVPYTRKEIAAMTGLRIETVIRLLKKLEKENIVKIIRSKVYY